MNSSTQMAPPLQVVQWFNTEAPIALEELRGKVVVIHAFQMLCPGCVVHGIPQATSIRETFPPELVVVLGLHTVFEHHEVMGPAALAAFIHEYRLRFPVGVDTPAARGPLPLTMQSYNLQGTPSLILIDRSGRIRLKHFGRMDDMRVGAIIGQLAGEGTVVSAADPSENAEAPGGCALDGQCDV